MRLKLPKHFARWVIFSAAAFLVGFIIAQLLIPAVPGGPSSVKRLIGGAQGQAPPESILEKQETSLFPIIAAGVILAILLAYGYFREKRKR